MSRESMLSPRDRHRLLVEWNSTAAIYPKDCLVTGLIAEQACVNPSAIALECNGATLSYGELEIRSSKLANHLRKRAIGAESIVGLLIERSFEMIVGLLGILKAGGAYLPLDLGYPPDRLTYMLRTAGARLVVAQSATAKYVPECIGETILLDEHWQDIDRESDSMPDPDIKAEDLAYVIYTSGSTGVPKGVMIPHRALSNHMLWMRDAFPLKFDDVVLQKTPLSFDASVWEVLTPLICGARLVLAKPNGHKDPAYLCAAVRASGVTTLQLVPSMLRLFLKEPSISQCSSLRNVFSGGEALTAELCALFFERLAAGLHNLYGPTETCIQAIVHSCTRADARGSTTVPIGRPISNTQAYVLNESLDLVPIGAEGELHIGGAGLARGYCAREDLTRQRFLDNPFGEPGARMYRTGDRVRYREDGYLEFIGRADEQVKLRGYRVELGEIEELLMSHAAVEEAVVIAADEATGNKRLIAFIVTSKGERVEASALRGCLEKALPEFMIPSQFVHLMALPRLTSGKVDRNALHLDGQIVRGTRDSQPLSPTQLVLADIWEQVLDVKNVGPSDDFFSLGGSSIQLLYVLSQAGQLLGNSISVEALHRGATLAEMAALFEAGELEATPDCAAARVG